MSDGEVRSGAGLFQNRHDCFEQIHAGADDVVHIEQRWRWRRLFLAQLPLPFQQGQPAAVTPVQPHQIKRVEMLWASAAHEIGELSGVPSRPR